LLKSVANQKYTQRQRLKTPLFHLTIKTDVESGIKIETRCAVLFSILALLPANIAGGGRKRTFSGKKIENK
jgi:hypothetical protein